MLDVKTLNKRKQIFGQECQSKNQPDQNAILRTSNFALYLLYLFSQYLLLLVVVNAVKVDYNQHYRC